jgi:hypothetical protein
MQTVRTFRGGVIFVCDECLEQLDDEDSGEFYWADYERFLETVGSKDEEPALLLCKACLSKNTTGSYFDSKLERSVELDEEWEEVLFDQAVDRSSIDPPSTSQRQGQHSPFCSPKNSHHARRELIPNASAGSFE